MSFMTLPLFVSVFSCPGLQSHTVGAGLPKIRDYGAGWNILRERRMKERKGRKERKREEERRKERPATCYEASMYKERNQLSFHCTGPLSRRQSKDTLEDSDFRLAGTNGNTHIYLCKARSESSQKPKGPDNSRKEQCANQQEVSCLHVPGCPQRNTIGPDDSNSSETTRRNKE